MDTINTRVYTSRPECVTLLCGEVLVGGLWSMLLFVHVSTGVGARLCWGWFVPALPFPSLRSSGGRAQKHAAAAEEIEKRPAPYIIT